MNKKQFLRSYDSLSGAIATFASCPRAERTAAIVAVRSRASELMADIKFANSRTGSDEIETAERLVDKATAAVFSVI